MSGKNIFSILKRIVSILITVLPPTLYLAWCILSGALDRTILDLGEFIAFNSLVCGLIAFFWGGHMAAKFFIKKLSK